jgi:di/tripeptidase
MLQGHVHASRMQRFAIMQHEEPRNDVGVQGHVDMVTEKNSDVVHDFFNDPLRLLSDGVWLKVLHATLDIFPKS